jgi:WD40 repeat protein
MTARYHRLGLFALVLPLLPGSDGEWGIERSLLSVPIPAERTDLQGDPLPDGAVLRLGSVRWRPAEVIGELFLCADGSRLVSGGAEGKVRVWDGATGRQLRAAPDLGQPLAISPDGRLVVYRVRGAGEIQVWDAAADHRLWERPADRERAAFAPTGKLVALAGVTGVIELADPRTGGAVRELRGAGGSVVSLGFSADGQVLAAAHGAGGLDLWDTTTGRLLWHDAGHAGPTALSPDGLTLAVSRADHPRRGDLGVHLMEAVTGRELRTCPGHRGSAITLAAFTPDGRTLVTGADDGTARVWDVASGRERGRVAVAPTRGYLTFALSGDGRTLAVGQDTRIRLFDAQTGRERTSPGHRGEVVAVACSPDGRRIATGGSDGEVRVWDAATGRELRQFTDAEARPQALAFLPDGRGLAALNDRCTLRVWDVETGERLRSVSCGPPLSAAALAPDGRTVLTAFQEPQVRRWEVTTGRPLPPLADPRPADRGLRGLTVTATGRTLVGLLDVMPYARATGKDPELLCLWDLASGRLVRRFGEVHVALFSPRTELAASPDGRLLAAGGANDPTVWLWDLATGRERRALAAPVGGVRALAFSPDGRLIAGAGWDGSLRLWELGARREMRRLTGHRSGVTAVAFTPDGRRLVSASADCTALVWDLAPARPAAVKDDLPALWADLASEDGPGADAAAGALLALPAATVMPFLRDRLAASAARGAAAQVRELVLQLEAPRYADREQATRGLEELGEMAEPELRLALDAAPTLEKKLRVERLLEALRQAAPAPGFLRLQRALGVLGQSEAPEARTALAALADTPAETWVSRQAREALGRWDRR